MHDRIELHQYADLRSIPIEDVYFAFGDGRYEFDCVSCGAKCCRGFGYTLSPRDELATQMALRPTLPLFVEVGQQNGVQRTGVANFAPGCFFLRTDGKCEVHATFGLAEKPETCRLFPFNNFCLVDRFLIVTPHADLCPIAAASVGGSSLSHHTALFDEMARRGISSQIRRPSFDRGRAQDLVEQEREIVALAEEQIDCGDYLTFAELQNTLLRTRGDATCDLPGFATTFVDSLSQLIGSPHAAAARPMLPLIREMIAATPSLRARIVFGDSDRTEAALPASRLPHAMLVVYGIAESAALAGMSSVGYQAVSRMLARYWPLVRLLAQIGDAVTLRDLNSVHRQDSRFKPLIGDLIKNGRSDHALTLGEILKFRAPLDLQERIGFLRAFASENHAHIAPANQAVDRDSKRSSIGRLMTRLMSPRPH